MTKDETIKRLSSSLYDAASNRQEDKSPEAVLKTVSQWLEELPTEMEKLLKEKESVG